MGKIAACSESFILVVTSSFTTTKTINLPYDVLDLAAAGLSHPGSGESRWAQQNMDGSPDAPRNAWWLRNLHQSTSSKCPAMFQNSRHKNDHTTQLPEHLSHCAFSIASNQHQNVAFVRSPQLPPTRHRNREKDDGKQQQSGRQHRTAAVVRVRPSSLQVCSPAFATEASYVVDAVGTTQRSAYQCKWHIYIAVSVLPGVRRQGTYLVGSMNE